uniref:V-type proton ATPase subunit C n=1 Tax=Gasterosteus aculeatus aculeatus TaxID=481459 RepID=G3PHY6_GASAC
MTELWLVSVPLDKTSLTNVDKLKRILAKNNRASCFKFSIPDLKVRHLCSNGISFLLVSVIKKTLQCMKEVMEHTADKVQESTLANGVDLMSYVTGFQWDKAKYPTALPLCSLTEIINKEVSQMEEELKSHAAAYNIVKTTLERRLKGDLQSRSLNDIVKREDLVVSEYLTTLLVVVSRRRFLQWERTYESFSEFVVPRSKVLKQSSECLLFSIQKVRLAYDPHSFNVHEYSFDVEAKEQQETMQHIVHKKEQYGIFVHWLKVNFSGVFLAWIHLKALRVFVESVLRYGIPVSYQALVLHTDKKRSKKLKEELASLFIHLEPTASTSKAHQASCDIPELCQHEYFSYICYHINTNLLEIS